jgi:ATP-dependent Zn protease
MSSSVNVSLFHLAMGGATTFFDPTIQVITRKVVQRKIAVALAGRAAEQVILGEVTAGAGGSDTSDLGLANTLAFSAVARWGLASSDEPRWVGCAPEQIVASHRELADEAYELLRVAYDQALALIRRRTPHVRAIANALLKRRALAHADIVALLAEQPGARRAAAQRTRRKRA